VLMGMGEPPNNYDETTARCGLKKHGLASPAE
jgi:hypothetical protein